MASRRQITCTNKGNRLNTHERISQIGGLNEDGSRWKMTRHEAMRVIETGEYEFFVKMKGVIYEVIVSTSRFDYKYLKTTSDGEEPSSLLSLPDCP
jgi:hypothetical protein